MRYALRVIETGEVVDCDSAETLADWARSHENAVTAEWRAYIHDEMAHVFELHEMGELSIDEMAEQCTSVAIEVLDKILRPDAA